ncbi:hypothetical protein Q3G72_026747 [Acer saccharum]|nr:hypothetical protein Q3G72_026747 [Acer saccharum]
MASTAVFLKANALLLSNRRLNWSKTGRCRYPCINSANFIARSKFNGVQVKSFIPTSTGKENPSSISFNTLISSSSEGEKPVINHHNCILKTLKKWSVQTLFLMGLGMVMTMHGRDSALAHVTSPSSSSSMVDSLLSDVKWFLSDATPNQSTSEDVPRPSYAFELVGIILLFLFVYLGLTALIAHMDPRNYSRLITLKVALHVSGPDFEQEFDRCSLLRGWAARLKETVEALLDQSSCWTACHLSMEVIKSTPDALVDFTKLYNEESGKCDKKTIVDSYLNTPLREIRCRDTHMVVTVMAFVTDIGKFDIPTTITCKEQLRSILKKLRDLYYSAKIVTTEMLTNPPTLENSVKSLEELHKVYPELVLLS